MIPGRILLWATGRQSSPLLARCAVTPNHPNRRLLPVSRTSRIARAWESNAAAGEKTGHIEAAPNESILFFDNLFPLKLSPLISWRPWQTETDVTQLLNKFESSSGGGMLGPINLVKRAISDQIPMKVTDIIPRLKDGGAFVKFTHPNEITAAEIETKLADLLQKEPIKPWFNPFRGIKIGLVQGVPWLEDLYRLPKSRLRVEFVQATDAESPPELSQETLYSVFRRYGKISEITSQPSDSKVLPKFAYVDFVLVRDAIMAKNCLHGFKVHEQGIKNATRLRLSYEQRVKAHNIWNWFTSHPRIVIPILAGFLAAFTVVVFDPIREYFVKAHVQKTFEFTNSRFYKWFKRQTSDILTFRKNKSDQAGLNALFTHQRGLIEGIQNSLLETVDTFVVVHGPRGSGKRELILNQVLDGRSNVLVVDCKPIVEARGEAGTIKKLALEVGYRPVFSWANNLSSLVDLAVQSTTGVKAGFSENLESQVIKILQTTAAALEGVSLDGRKKTDSDAHLSADAYLEAHPERRAVIVIDNFLHRSEEKGIIYDKIADWAAALVQSNIAHVIFLTNDASYSKSLSKALPDRVFQQVTLGDLSPDVAKKFVLSNLETEARPTDDNNDEAAKPQLVVSEKQRHKDLKELDECIEALGGRLTDLQILARRLKIGQSPKKAVAEIIDQSASEILRMFLLANKSNGGEGAAGAGEKKWSAEQAWFLIKEIAQKESLRYNEVLLANTFAASTTPAAASGEAALESLANAELITIKTHGGRPQTIRAGKPVYQAAFVKLFNDIVVKARMDLAVLTELAKIEAKTIDKVENELSLLASLRIQPYQTAERANYLLAKMQGSQRKIIAYEAEIAVLKGVLSHEA
ncbi:RNA12 protein-domain-containing protein [Podospora appendiculata]|uniref:Mitochondrial escape protein 2 n=1 Tax=Podospora appendiculata TaxID=314037 RepID=A0AAE0X2J7_9PEZI|nr:RNA12 protein-domain-containing protein [Podospora appendiculata]